MCTLFLIAFRFRTTEKAIKLTMNDLVRDKLMTESGDITLAAEILAGATVSESILRTKRKTVFSYSD